MAILKEEDRNFVWRKPEKCPACQSNRIWGHGYVLRYFDEYPEGLYLKRFYCPECRAVHTARPVEYFPRFQTTIDSMHTCIFNKLQTLGWSSGYSRQRQQYWYQGLKLQAALFQLDISLSFFLSHSYKSRFCFPTHSINRSVKFSALELTYLSFAVTDHKIPP